MEEANLTSAIARASTYLRGRVLSSNCLETAAAVRTGTANGDAYADGDVNDELTLGISALLALARPMEEQVGGHLAVTGSTLGMLELDDGGRLRLVLKPMQNAGRGSREMAFYEDVAARRRRATLPPARALAAAAAAGRGGRGATDEVGGLLPFLPEYHGVVRLPSCRCRDSPPSSAGAAPPIAITSLPPVMTTTTTTTTTSTTKPPVPAVPTPLSSPAHGGGRGSGAAVAAAVRLSSGVSSDDATAAPAPGTAGEGVPAAVKAAKAAKHGQPECYILLEDCKARFVRPCVLDLKIGTITTEPDAPAAKRKKEFDKYPAQAELGFRFIGMRVWHPSRSEYRVFSKEFGLGVTAETARDAFAIFFGADLDESDTEGDVDDLTAAASSARRSPLRRRPLPLCRRDVALAFEARLRWLLAWFETQREFIFTSSSLLFVYEGEPLPLTAAGNRDGGGGRSGAASIDLRMIDFAHVRADGVRDEGYVHGLRNALAEISGLLDGGSHMCA